MLVNTVSLAPTEFTGEMLKNAYVFAVINYYW